MSKGGKAWAGCARTERKGNFSRMGVEELLERLKESSDKRVRWDMLRHMYILTTPNAMIFSYKSTLNKRDPLEANLMSMLGPITDGQAVLHLDHIADRFKEYLDGQGLIDMSRVGQDYFIEKLNCVADDMNLEEEDIRRRTESFENNRGFQLNTGRTSDASP